MTDLHSALQRYLSMRKGLGYKYQHQTRRLADFVSFMDRRKATTITTKLALEWATLPAVSAGQDPLPDDGEVSDFVLQS